MQSVQTAGTPAIWPRLETYFGPSCPWHWHWHWHWADICDIMPGACHRHISMQHDCHHVMMTSPHLPQCTSLFATWSMDHHPGVHTSPYPGTCYQNNHRSIDIWIHYGRRDNFRRCKDLTRSRWCWPHNWYRCSLLNKSSHSDLLMSLTFGI